MVRIAWMDPYGIKDITIHCAATPEGRDNSAEEIKQWDIDRFGQPSYHYVIELDGTTVQHLRHNQRGAHVSGHNTGNIGICYVGGTGSLNAGGKPKDTRTPAQKNAMAIMVAKLKQEYPQAFVRGHKDWPGVTKACPSFNVDEWLKESLR